MTKEHAFTSRIEWTGNRGEGTRHYRSYDRTWSVMTPGKPVITCSNDPLLGGDPTLHNPEDMLLSSLAACHMLWYLHLASNEGIEVVRYCDDPEGIGQSAPDGSGQFVRAILRPAVTIRAGGSVERAESLHGEIKRFCFIARSVNFPISYEPSVEIIN